LGIRRRRRIAGGIKNALPANSTYRLKALLLGVEIALGGAVIVHDGAPRRVLGENRTTDEKTCGDENRERKCEGSCAKSQHAGAPVLEVDQISLGQNVDFRYCPFGQAIAKQTELIGSGHN